MPIGTTSTAEIMERLKCCVLIPTYNNSGTLRKILEGVLEYTGDIIVVNDGSTDGTLQILADFPQIQQLHFPHNQGKGLALRKGFELANKLGFSYTITIDSDGQHFPNDIPVLVNALNKEKNKKVLFIGARNMGQADVPKKSSFGNRFSNFWFWIETGIKLQDTQSGYRVYPIFTLRDIPLYTKKFELEIEVIVKAAWNGVQVRNIPVKVNYDPHERVSHFRPFTDFVRISILNTYLVLIALFYIFPRDLVRKLKKKGFRRFIQEDLMGSNDSHEKKALSMALGIFIGLSPLWGFHTLIVLFLAILFKLNKAIAFAFSNISLPPFIPLVLFVSLKLGYWIVGSDFGQSPSEIGADLEMVKHLKSYIIGSFALSLIGASITGTLGYLFLTIFDRKKMELNNG